MERHTHESVSELQQQECSTPEGVAEVLEIGLNVVQHAAFSGELHGQIVELDIISLSWEDARAWFMERDGIHREGLADARE